MTGIIMSVLILSGCQWNQYFDENEKGKKIDNVSDQSSLEESEKLSEENNSNGKNASNKIDKLVLEASYFNEVTEVNGKKEIVNAENTMALVNKTYSLPGDYIPQDLMRPNVAFSFGEQDIEKSYLRKEAAIALEKMFEAAKKDGIQLYASSGYRSYNRQKKVFQVEASKSGEEKAAQVVAFPGNSEHQTGLAMDITSESMNFLLNEDFANKPEGRWLKDNAHMYGFILRYPKGKEEITGYQFEPWHFRYVGEKAAKIIHERNWTMEEYFEHVSKI